MRRAYERSVKHESGRAIRPGLQKFDAAWRAGQFIDKVSMPGCGKGSNKELVLLSCDLMYITVKNGPRLTHYKLSV